MTQTLTFTVAGMSCAHCKAAVTAELLAVAGVNAIDVDLATKQARVTGEALDDARLRAAIAQRATRTADVERPVTVR
jgi:copper chaperone